MPFCYDNGMNSEVYNGNKDSDKFVRSVLAKGFELQEADLTREQVLELLAKAIADIPGETTKVVSLIGGAASGKTSLSKMLAEKMAEKGVSADAIGTDDFNIGDRSWRWENFEGDNPKDPRSKYDFDLLNQKIDAIKANHDPTKTVAVPTYNQATGLAVDAGEENYTHHIGPVDALVVEGDFHPVSQPDLVVFLHVPDDQRLQNRIDRDVVHRGADEAKTTANFNLRQERQHFPHTLPTVESANIVLDATVDGQNWRYNVYQAKPATA